MGTAEIATTYGSRCTPDADAATNSTAPAATTTSPPATVAPSTSCAAAMIVIGSRGRGTLAASVLGSVPSSVAARSDRPVLVVRGRG